MNSSDTIGQDDVAETSEKPLSEAEVRQEWNTAIQRLGTALKEWNVMLERVQKILATQSVEKSVGELYATACAVENASFRKSQYAYEAGVKYGGTKEIGDLISGARLHKETAVLAEGAVLLLKEAMGMVIPTDVK